MAVLGDRAESKSFQLAGLGQPEKIFHFFDHIAQWVWRSLASNGVERYNFSHDVTP